MADIDKLTQSASSELKAGEAFKARIVGKTSVGSAGGEIVAGFAGFTDHHLVILAHSLFGKRLEAFPYSQVGAVTHNKDENYISIGLPGGETFIVSDLWKLPNPEDFTKFIADKRKADKVVFEATNLMTPPAKK